jgi:hypothetical protein
MNRDNHYEAAFEAYLRQYPVGLVAVDEARRSVLGDTPVKSLDFIVISERAKLVIDVKGRRFPGGKPGRPQRTWQNWVSQADVIGLQAWARALGPGFRGVLAFVYHIVPPYRLTDDTPDLIQFRDANYLMRAVEISAYADHMRPRSARWGTGTLSVADFRQCVRPFSEVLDLAPIHESFP